MKLLLAIFAIGGAVFWVAIDLFRPLDQTLAFALLGLTLVAGGSVLAWAVIPHDADDSDSYLPKPRYIVVVSLPWLFALALFLNAFLDRSAPTQHPAAVVSKSERAFGQSLTVTSWRPGRSVESIPVDAGLYSKLPQRGPIIVTVKPGLLGIPWVSGFEHLHQLNL